MININSEAESNCLRYVYLFAGQSMSSHLWRVSLFFGMPGLVADSLPDSFGNAVIEKWLASIGKSLSDFTAIDRLCYIGKLGIYGCFH